ncbi:alcohol dehydrogenase catalytic domain-containing protein [Butyricicoccus faecihominis]|uniref:zinc-dependent alcohol dehydrogenase n=1 Tax=Butyricicoccus faecihominis TaxID=1712515 RepID=UPI00247B202F|nr:alcohol dehydrogenase catalytic domain-containing protein [Butyricicoccus faecihominis]MCQ5128493.1 alcohol dehydrogenase catalytic domain-containing protein [Butyricicoccus faecihominis]
MSNLMRAAIFEGNGVLTVKSVPIPQLQRDTQLLLKIEAASICGSDLHGLAVPPGQYMKPGIVYGHEFCGTIVKMGQAVQGFALNERVAVNPRVRCGACYECTHGKGDLCSNSYHYGQTGDGGFAQYALVEAKQLYRVDPSIPPEIAAQAEPLACVMNAIHRARPTPVDHVLLYGAGPIGLTFVRVLKLFGIQNLIVTAKGERRVQEARNCGADIVVDTQKERVEDVMRAHWPYGADLVIDAVGRGPIFSEALPLMNPQGRLILFGFDANASTTLPPSLFTLNELSVCGVLGKDFPSALEILKRKDLALDRFITHRLALDDILQGIDLMRRKEACRVIVYPNGSPIA